MDWCLVFDNPTYESTRKLGDGLVSQVVSVYVKLSRTVRRENNIFCEIDELSRDVQIFRMEALLSYTLALLLGVRLVCPKYIFIVVSLQSYRRIIEFQSVFDACSLLQSTASVEE